MLTLMNISKRYGEQIVLNNLSVQFSEKGISVIIGVNGSGKTTLMNLITGIEKLDSGDIRIEDQTFETRIFKRKIFYLPSDFFLPEFMTGIEYLKFITQRYEVLYKKENAEKLLTIFDLYSQKNQTIETYSFGMKKKIQIIAAILSKAQYILADEVLSGLDFETMILVHEIFSRISKDRAIIMITHDKQTIEAFDSEVYLLEKTVLQSTNKSADELVAYFREGDIIHDKINTFTQYMDNN